MIAADSPFAAVARDGETHLKLRGNFLRSSQRNEEAVEIGAVAELAVARPDRVAVAPTDAFFAVLHMAIDDVVESSGGFQLGGAELFTFNEVQGLPIQRHKFVRLKEAVNVF